MDAVYSGGMLFYFGAIGHGILYGTKALLRGAIGAGRAPIFDEDEYEVLKRIVAAGTFAVASVSALRTFRRVNSISGGVIGLIYLSIAPILGTYVFLDYTMGASVPRPTRNNLGRQEFSVGPSVGPIVSSTEKIKYTAVSVASVGFFLFMGLDPSQGVTCEQLSVFFTQGFLIKKI